MPYLGSILGPVLRCDFWVLQAVREEEERAKVGRERAAREKKQREDKNAAQRNKLMKQTLDKLMQGKKAAAKPA